MVLYMVHISLLDYFISQQACLHAERHLKVPGDFTNCPDVLAWPSVQKPTSPLGKICRTSQDTEGALVGHICPSKKHFALPFALYTIRRMSAQALRV